MHFHYIYNIFVTKSHPWPFVIDIPRIPKNKTNLFESIHIMKNDKRKQKQEWKKHLCAFEIRDYPIPIHSLLFLTWSWEKKNNSWSVAHENKFVTQIDKRTSARHLFHSSSKNERSLVDSRKTSVKISFDNLQK